MGTIKYQIKENQTIKHEVTKMKALTNKEVLQIGTFDKGGRFYLYSDFETETSRAVRAPSRAWPFSVYKHCFTQKYFKSLSDAQKRMLGLEEA